MPKIVIIAEVSHICHDLFKGGANIIPDEGEFMNIPVFIGEFMHMQQDTKLIEIMLECIMQKKQNEANRLLMGYSEHQEDDPDLYTTSVDH